MKVKMIVSLVVICLVAAALLSIVYDFTTKKIEEERRAKVLSQLQEVFPCPGVSFQPIIQDTLWAAYKGEEKLGIVFKTHKAGYGGTVETLVGLNLDTTVVAIRPATPAEGLKETPGLGTKIGEAWFKEQFKGKKPNEVLLKKDGGTLDAITGATISSRAVANGVRDGIEKYKKYLGNQAIK
ncbi:MAG TPA: RnfABCDGE type electron transport complex subunit G [bacterium (Candidatus Stahlbacteria)]|nr:RnfABCDGE type electron transport complex subunit G [Candidatus Stahlbacteria bacterium]